MILFSMTKITYDFISIMTIPKFISLTSSEGFLYRQYMNTLFKKDLHKIFTEGV